MKLFDEFGNEVGEVFEDSIHMMSNVTSDSFDDVQLSLKDSVLGGIFMGILVLIVKWPVSLIFIAVLAVLRLILIGVIKLVILAFRIIWWLVRIPYSLFTYGEFPEF